jgi:hypothetical protein
MNTVTYKKPKGNRIKSVIHTRKLVSGLLPSLCGLTSCFTPQSCLSFVLFFGAPHTDYCTNQKRVLAGVAANGVLNSESCTKQNT